jgi:hypothetical protein
MTTHPATAAGITQCEAILRALQAREGEWVPMPILARYAGAYAVHSRIADLRRRGHRIEHKNEHAGRRIYSFYRILSPITNNP